MAADAEREIQSSFCESSQAAGAESCDIEAGKYFGNIKAILDKTTERCFAPVRFENISSRLAEIRDKNPAAFDSVVPQLIECLQDNVKQELELMFEQENLISLCHQLEQVQKSSTDKDEAAWRPSGIPSEDIKDHVISVKLEFRDKLREKLKQLQDENEVVKNNLTSTSTEIKETEHRIIEKHKELKTVVTACDEFDDNPDNKYSLKNIIDELEK